MENKKQTYLQWFKQRYGFNWLIFILILHIIATIKQIYSDYPYNSWIPVMFCLFIYIIVFFFSFNQYKKEDKTNLK